jgi:hypothetical protein
MSPFASIVTPLIVSNWLRQIRREVERRVEHERAVAIIGTELEPHAVARYAVTPVDELRRGARALVDERPALDDVAERGVQQQVAARVELETLRAVDRERDLSGIGARREHEVVLETVAVPVVGDVDAAIGVVDDDARVARNVGMPAARLCCRSGNWRGPARLERFDACASRAPRKLMRRAMRCASPCGGGHGVTTRAVARVNTVWSRPRAA